MRDQPRQWAQGPQDVQRRMTQKQPVLYPVHSSTHAPARESMQEALQQRPQPCSREAQEQAAQVKERKLASGRLECWRSGLRTRSGTSIVVLVGILSRLRRSRADMAELGQIRS